MATINTGGVKPCRTGAENKITLEVVDTGKSRYHEQFVVSCYGWKRQYVTGQGPTPREAVADWCKQTGNDLTAVVSQCRIIDENGAEVVL